MHTGVDYIYISLIPKKEKIVNDHIVLSCSL